MWTTYTYTVALSTEVPRFPGTHRFSLIGKGTYQFCPKIKKSTTGNPSIKIADKAPVTVGTGGKTDYIQHTNEQTYILTYRMCTTK